MEALAVVGSIASSPAFTIASTAFQVIGALSQAGSASANYKSQAQANEYNAAVARNESQRALNESAAAQMAQRRRATQILGQQRAATVQSGTGTGGSNADLYGQSATLAELDALNLAYEGEVRSRGYLAQSDLDSYYAGVNRSNARGARTSGLLNAGGALFSGAQSFGGGAAPRKSVLTSGYRGLRPGGGLGLRY